MLLNLEDEVFTLYGFMDNSRISEIKRKVDIFPTFKGAINLKVKHYHPFNKVSGH